MNGSKILIVDDEVKNIKLLKGMLFSEDYQFYEATNGKEAMDLVHEISPDLILLDVMMPGINGFEVCRRLKDDEKTKMIPILMVTALWEKEHRLKAMESGADDFLSKPVDRTEVMIRVKSLLRIKAYQDKLSDNYKEIAAKNERLLELEKIKDGLVQMIIHDLNNPLAVISGNIDLVVSSEHNLTPDQLNCLKISYRSGQELSQMIRGLLEISKMEDGKMKLNIEKVKPESLIDASIQQFLIKADEKQIAMSYERLEKDLLILVDCSLVKRALGNLLNNAIRHTPRGGKIQIITKPDQHNGKLRVEVKDTGSGLAPEYHKKIFDKFEQVKLKKSGIAVGTSGLGLAFCKLAVEAHGGRIWVESEGEGKGANFQFTLPVKKNGAKLE